MSLEWVKKTVDRIQREQAERTRKEEYEIARARNISTQSGYLWERFTGKLDAAVTNLNLNLTSDMKTPFRFSKRSENYLVVDVPPNAAELVIEFNEQAHIVKGEVKKPNSTTKSRFSIDMDNSGELYFKGENGNFSTEKLVEHLLESFIF